MPAVRPFRNREVREIIRGEGLSLQFTVYSNTAHTTTSDISSANISLTFKLAKKTSDSAVLTKTSATSTEIEKSDPTNGVFLVKLENSDTSSLDLGSYRFDVLLTDTGTDPDTNKIIALGDIVISEGISL